ncbi:MAG TPA: response regulator, partial [Spirochaetia bacterium]|nr:response regulator [Spirochaetia bacterium]
MNGESERVLVIDDNEGIREGCCRALRAAGYEVQSASNGQEALRIFREQDHFAAALIDLHLPGMDGLELTTRIHECDSDAVLL